VLIQIGRQFGKGSVMRMGDVGANRDIEVISTGSLGLDIALGCGGLPRGRVVPARDLTPGLNAYKLNPRKIMRLHYLGATNSVHKIEKAVTVVS